MMIYITSATNALFGIEELYPLTYQPNTPNPTISLTREYMNKKEILLENAIFESNEDEDTIEHVDMGYAEFMEKLRKLAE